MSRIGEPFLPSAEDVFRGSLVARLLTSFFTSVRHPPPRLDVMGTGHRDTGTGTSSFSAPTVEAAVVAGVLQQQPVRVQRRLEDKDSAVEAVRPARVRGRGQLATLEQLVDVAQYLARDSRGPWGTAL